MRTLFAGLLVLVLGPALGAAEDWPKYRHDTSNTGHCADMVFVGSTDKNLHGVTRAGTEIFTFLTGGTIDSGPAISNGRIYFGSTDGKVYALSPNGQ